MFISRIRTKSLFLDRSSSRWLSQIHRKDVCRVSDPLVTFFPSIRNYLKWYTARNQDALHRFCDVENLKY